MELSDNVGTELDEAQEPIQVVGRGGKVARITLNRPDQRNPLDKHTIKKLRHVIAELEADCAVHIITVRGAGGHFSAGGDLKGYVDLYRHPDEFREFLVDFHGMLDEIESSRKIYVAVVDGYCVAGGLEVLLACDIVMAGSSAKIGDGHIRFGQLPGAGGSQRLMRKVGPTRARYLMLTGDIITATEAERIGLVSRVVADEALDHAMAGLIKGLSGASSLGLAGMKRLANIAERNDLTSGLRAELEYVHDYASNSVDASEGLMAFQEKRAPQFTGR